MVFDDIDRNVIILLSTLCLLLKVVGAGGVMGYIILNGVPHVLSTPLYMRRDNILRTLFNTMYTSTQSPYRRHLDPQDGSKYPSGVYKLN